MSFYLDLLKQQYSLLEDAHQKSLQESKVVEQASTLCACGLAYIADCPAKGCLSGRSAVFRTFSISSLRNQAFTQVSIFFIYNLSFNL